MFRTASRSICSCSQAVSKSVWHITLLCVQWKTPDDWHRQCPKHVEFLSINKFEKLVHLVGFIIRNLSRCTVTWNSIRGNVFRFSEQAIDWEGTLGSSSGVNPPGMKLTPHLRLDYRLRMSGSLLPLRMSLWNPKGELTLCLLAYWRSLCETSHLTTPDYYGVHYCPYLWFYCSVALEASQY